MVGLADTLAWSATVRRRSGGAFWLAGRDLRSVSIFLIRVQDRIFFLFSDMCSVCSFLFAMI